MKLHFVHSIRGLQNFLAIPIMNTLAGFMIQYRRYAITCTLLECYSYKSGDSYG